MRGYFPQCYFAQSIENAQFSVRHRLTLRLDYREERELTQLNLFDLAAMLTNTVQKLMNGDKTRRLQPIE
jgi:hypothetical protein